MTMDDREIVSAVHQALVGKVGEKLVQLWASDGVTWQLAGQTLTILARCSFRLERLRRHRAEFNAVACQFAGPQATVDWKLNDAVQAGTAAGSPAAAPIQRELPGLPPPIAVGQLAKEPVPSSPADATIEASPAALSSSAPVIFRLPSNPAPVHNGDSSPAPHPSPTNKMTRRNFASLDEFVVGEGNRLAHAAVNNLLGQLGRYSPLFISGPPGCGKTHLLEGVWRLARKTTPSRRTIYLSAEQFTT